MLYFRNEIHIERLDFFFANKFGFIASFRVQVISSNRILADPEHCPCGLNKSWQKEKCIVNNIGTNESAKAIFGINQVDSGLFSSV